MCHQNTDCKSGGVRYRYEAVCQTVESDELGVYTSYGIRVRDGEAECGFVGDVSTDAQEVIRLAERCTALELDPDQLYEVIEDFLVERSSL